jgi:hypothetical protein
MCVVWSIAECRSGGCRTDLEKRLKRSNPVIESNRSVRIKRLENVITTVYHRNYRGGLFKWIQDNEDAFTELVLLVEKIWNDDGSKKRRFVQNVQNIGMVDTVFEELVRNKSFIGTCNFLRSNSVRHDQQTKEKATSQGNAISQPSNSNKKDKAKQVLSLTNEYQIQDSSVLEDEVEISTAFNTSTVCKLAQVPPEICNSLSLEAKKCSLTGENVSKKKIISSKGHLIQIAGTLQNLHQLNLLT